MFALIPTWVAKLGWVSVRIPEIITRLGVECSTPAYMDTTSVETLWLNVPTSRRGGKEPLAVKVSLRDGWELCREDPLADTTVTHRKIKENQESQNLLKFLPSSDKDILYILL